MSDLVCWAAHCMGARHRSMETCTLNQDSYSLGWGATRKSYRNCNTWRAFHIGENWGCTIINIASVQSKQRRKDAECKVYLSHPLQVGAVLQPIIKLLALPADVHEYSMVG